MLNLPQKGILIAPASLHLSLYQKVLKTHGNTLGLEILSLQSYIQRFFKTDPQTSIDFYYQVRELCQTIPEENAFYASRSSFAFIQELTDFAGLAKSYALDFDKLPEQTQKEKDLKILLQQIQDLPYWQAEIPKILRKDLDASNVTILPYEYSESEQLWIQKLLASHAQVLKLDAPGNRHYWSTGNPRKQAQQITKTILGQDLEASEVFVSCNDNAEKQVLAQIFDQHQIPYTILSSDQKNPFAAAFLSALAWILEPDLDHYLVLIDLLYPQTRQIIQSTLRNFPALWKQAYSFPEVYEENTLLTQEEFEHLKHHLKQTQAWLQEHDAILNWSIDTLDAILTTIQNQLPCTEDNLNAFYWIQEQLRQSWKKIRTAEDLQFFKDYIEAKIPSKSIKHHQGVLIGSRKEITPFFSTVFLCGAHAANFPAFSMHTGIFDEAYLASCDFPSLSSRLQKQREQLWTVLENCQDLYVLVAESDYNGKDHALSHELEQWFGHGPVFQEFQDPMRWSQPQFACEQETAQALFFDANQFVGSVSRLESFARCPFQHFLRYGLHLQEREDLKDIRIRGSIYHAILEKLIQKHQKAYTAVDHRELLSLIEQEFSFAQKIHPEKQAFFQTQIQEIFRKMKKLLQNLAAFEKEWHMTTHAQECKVSMSLMWNDTPVILYGYIDRIDASQTSFMIFDYKTGKRTFALSDFESGQALQLITYAVMYESMHHQLPVGCFYISLNTSLQDASACKINYRKKFPEIEETSWEELSEQALESRSFAGVRFQDLSIYADEPSRFGAKRDKALSFETIQAQWQTILFDLLRDIQSGNIQPAHAKDACTYCAYRSICRNSAQEVKKSSRLEKEDVHAI